MQTERAIEELDDKAGEVEAQPRPRALVVDDSRTVLLVVASLLSREHIDSVCTTNPAEAIELAKRHDVDIILSDVNMDGAMSGFELCRLIRADSWFNDVPVVLLTGDADPNGKAHGLEEGADDYLTKPVRPRELKARLWSLINLRRARLEVRRKTMQLENAHAELLSVQSKVLEGERATTLANVAAGLAHEINNPMAVLMSGADELARLATEGGAPGEIEEVRAEVQSSAHRIAEIVARLGKLAFGPDSRGEQVGLREEIDRSIAIAHPRLRNAQVSVRAPEDFRLCAPPGFVAQILVELLVNAADATARVASPRIEVEVTASTSEIAVAVTDNGAGVASEHRARVFEPFFTTKSAGRGAGLGLSVCLSMMKRMGGDLVMLSSEPGHGTTVRATFPLRNDPRASFNRSRSESQRRAS